MIGPDLSIIIPVYEEEESLPELVEQIAVTCTSANLSFEVFLVDDGSRDKTWDVIKNIHHEDPRFGGLRFRRNYGESAALAMGFKNANGKYVVTVDADLQDDPAEIPALVELLEEAVAIHEEDVAANRKMGELGAALITANSGVLTHCNAGALATGGYGTALGVIRSASAAGKITQVYADETRPWLQGARLTAWELLQDNIPVNLIVEGAAAALMQSGAVQWFIVGSDRIAANGDVANKIGTYMVAILARTHKIPFYVAAPMSTIDASIKTGKEIPIEQRHEKEVTHHQGRRCVPEGVGIENPAFDVTPHRYVSAIITEKGVITPPFKAKIRRLFASE